MASSRFLCWATVSLSVLFIAYETANAQNRNDYVSIEKVLQHAYANNPTLKAAQEELKEVQELYPQARAGWLPTVSAETSIYAADVESSNFGAGDGATTKDLSLNVDQPLWRGGRTSAETARANDLIRAGEAVLMKEEQDVFIEAITAYLNVLRDGELLDLREKNEAILLQELKAAWERMEIGDITETDVQQAKTRLSGAKSESIDAKANFEISKAEFEQIVGMKPPAKLLIPHPDFAFPKNLNAMYTYAETRNPEILIANFRHQAAEHNTDATFREMFPQISAFASVNKQYDPQPGIVDDTKTEMVGVRAKWVLFEGGVIRSRTREARSAAKRREYEIQEAKQRIRQTISSNWHSYTAAQSQTENRKEEIESAESALKGVKIEAKEGQRTILDILDADQELIDAKAELVNARRNETLAQYALASSLGMLSGDMFKPASEKLYAQK